jgi:hypothetical protein
MNRQGVEHLVGNNRTAELLRQRIQPVEPLVQMRQALLQRRLLTCAQIGAHFKDAIGLRQMALFFQFRQQVAGKFSAARAQFQNVR